MSENGMGPGISPLPERQRYQLLLEITGRVVRSRSVTDAFHELADPVLALTGAELLNLSLHDANRECMTNYYHWKKNRENGEVDIFPVETAASGWAWKHQESIAIPDTAREVRFPGCIPFLRQQGVRSYTVLPMSTPSRRFGALGLGKDVPELLQQDDLELLSRIASIGALALEREKAYEAFEEQQSLLEISRELSSILDVDRLVGAVLSSIRKIARYEQAVLALLDPEGKNVLLYGATSQWEPHVNQGNATPVGQALAGESIHTRKVAHFTANGLLGVNSALANAMYLAGVQSVCTIPLVASDRVWGALHASSDNENAFGRSETEYLGQVATMAATALQNAQSYREIAQLKERLAREKHYLEAELRSGERSEEIVGNSPALKRVLESAAIVADTDSTVLITGETGTGKERIARLIHGRSGRRDRSFIKLNCAAIPTGLLESELFGHEKGAFTGAVSQKIGRLELADKGTLLLDEVGDIPLELQPKLLRVLQDHEFERLGGTKTIKVDVRLIAATNRDLVRAVDDKEFRSDLFYRLHVFPLHLPPLRDRRDDIPMLIRYFVEKSAARLRRRIDVIPEEAMVAMARWRWPGNIRELENFIERSVILSEGNRLTPPLGELRDEISRQPSDSDGTLREKERSHIIDILRQTNGALSGPSGAAARLGLKRTTLQYKMQRLGISRMDYLR